MIKVGHFHYCFFERSETFIYHQLSSLKRYRPVAISLISRNRDEFPLSNGSIYDVGVNLPRPGMQFLGPFRHFSLQLARELFRREQIRLLHAHFGTWGSYALPLKKTLRVGMIVAFYGQDISMLPRRSLWLSRFKRLWHEADLFLAEGPHMMKELINLGAPREKVRLQRIGIPVSKIEFNLPLRKRGGTIQALWAGRMVEKKGLLDTLQALKLLTEQGIKITLRIVGDGPLRKSAKLFVKENRLEEKVTFLDFLTYRRYLEEFKKADFFLAPSRTASTGETEGGAPTTILEAQARGLPVVATRHADIPFVMPQAYPYLAEETSPHDLAMVIKKLIADRKHWPRIARRSRKHVMQFHDLSVTTKTLEDYYEDLLAKK
ncbi:glycosyltransferase [candidate division WOR-3 bacterium]|nr:glycosyltransferase [candidate division WOR-3 bacterium]